MSAKEDEKITINGKEYKQFADGNYDIVILGTGLTNSLLAAILSIKKSMSVLHIDVNSYYGGEGASLMMSEIYNHFGRENKLNKEQMKEKFGNTRKFNVDLIPKLIMSNGKLIQFLVKAVRREISTLLHFIHFTKHTQTNKHTGSSKIPRVQHVGCELRVPKRWNDRKGTSNWWRGSIHESCGFLSETSFEEFPSDASQLS